MGPVPLNRTQTPSGIRTEIMPYNHESVTNNVTEFIRTKRIVDERSIPGWEIKTYVGGSNSGDGVPKIGFAAFANKTGEGCEPDLSSGEATKVQFNEHTYIIILAESRLDIDNKLKRTFNYLRGS